MSKLRPTRPFLKKLETLQSGRLTLKDSVKNITLYYNTWGNGSWGIRKFISENVPPIQFKNPDVQMVTFKNVSDAPALHIFFGDGKKVTLDVEGKKPEKILRELSSVAGQLESQVRKAQEQAKYNPANFGDARKGRFCICEVPGQVPCPSRVPLQNVEHKWHEKSTTTNE